ncbi:Rhodanese-related sulfurtransferase [Raineyella antarctica]|uniref:Rhodanese-related sulfurtransferase n=1 Tax=Raineyella antarctica TaxID=1577474 RepID=A0A1G6GID1_9ACTN|nr:rhodanese-like domain-containing protein [Raineyella antarctica]SDB81757.1 Rhodanese-related sulfurtransferase [Raineyella antarctica]
MSAAATKVATDPRPLTGRAWAVVVTLLLGVLTLAGCAGGNSVTTATPTQWISASSKPGVVVVDVRTPQEYAAGHVKDAINVDVESPDFATRIAGLDKATSYAVYCQSGRRSALATKAMQDAGFTSITNLKGGIGDLAAAGAPIVS